MEDIMLRIKRKKLIIAKIFSNVGLMLIGLGTILTPWILYNSLYIISVGGLIGLIGVQLTDKLYKCPRCGAKLLVVGSPLDKLFNKVPLHCPNCGTKIEIQIF